MKGYIVTLYPEDKEMFVSPNDNNTIWDAKRQNKLNMNPRGYCLHIPKKRIDLFVEEHIKNEWKVIDYRNKENKAK